VRPAVVVDPGDDAHESLRRLAASGGPGIVVRTARGPVVIPSSQVLRVALPRYVLDDPSLGRVWDEASADRVADVLAGRRVVDLLGVLDEEDERVAAVVDPDATLVEVAAVMAEAHAPLVAVVDGADLLGVVTVAQVLERLVG
jgi:CBS domain-containing protein